MTPRKFRTYKKIIFNFFFLDYKNFFPRKTSAKHAEQKMFHYTSIDALSEIPFVCRGGSINTLFSKRIKVYAHKY